MSLRYCPVLVATLVFTAGCQRSTTVVALPPPKVVKPPVDELAETVQEAVKKASDVAACRRLIEQVNAAQQSATRIATAFQQGAPGVELSQVMLEMQKASVAFRAATEVRNRLVSVYQEIMNMPI